MLELGIIKILFYKTICFLFPEEFANRRKTCNRTKYTASLKIWAFQRLADDSPLSLSMCRKPEEKISNSMSKTMSNSNTSHILMENVVITKGREILKRQRK